MRTPSPSLLYSRLLTESTCFQVGYVDCGSARPRHDKTLFIDVRRWWCASSGEVSSAPGNRGGGGGFSSFDSNLKKEKEKVKKVLIGDDLFRYIYPPVVEDEYKATVSLLRSFEETNALNALHLRDLDVRVSLMRGKVI